MNVSSKKIKHRQLAGYYLLEMTSRQLGKLRAGDGGQAVVSKILIIPQVKGIMWAREGLEVNIHAGDLSLGEVLEKVVHTIQDHLI